jgi:hypothetical protein
MIVKFWRFENFTKRNSKNTLTGAGRVIPGGNFRG